ncbi:MAG: phenylalanine--tRNA ligase subunit alpha [Candidatus Anstonellales archaeon]
MILHEYESSILEYLKKTKRAEDGELVKSLSLPLDGVRRAAYWLSEKGLAKISEKEEIAYEITDEGKRFLMEGFPEERVLEYNGKSINALEEELKTIGLGKAKKEGWIEIENGVIKVLKRPEKYHLREALERKKPEPELLHRKLLVEKREKHYSIQITEKGMEFSTKEERGIGELTSDIIKSGEWKEKGFRPYNIKFEKGGIKPGRKHPITIAIEKISRIFRDMGFVEMQGGYVETAFWNFDALFQPQDHPARDLADTFYLDGESKEKIDEQLIKRVKKQHEKSWNYKWSFEEARKLVLRTHTTVLSARTLAKLKKGTGKFFSIGRVFRNEATDFKHLAEFHQIEGIVVWKKANFRHLLGVLKEFYSRLGFEKIRFRPSYFPYTEPSLEVEVFFEPKNEWMELGGAGIFRPEVCKPLGATWPVLAWGLSLERPLMMMLGLEDIRTFYKNDLRWLDSVSSKGVF